MDTIEFRSMNSDIQTDARAAFVQPTQAYTQNNRSNGKSRSGCSNGCGSDYGRNYDNGCSSRERDYDNSRSSGYDNDNRSSNYENGRSGCSNGCSSNSYDNNRSNGYDKNYGNSRSNGYDKNYDNSRSNGYENGCSSNSEYTRNGHIYYNGCEEVKVNEMDDREIGGTGRIMDVAMTLKNVCPCHRVSVGYMVTEMDEQNNEHSRGFKCFTVPAHYNSECCDVEVERTRFILPDDARVDGCTGHCNGRRHFIVRAEAHYADTNVTMP